MSDSKSQRPHLENMYSTSWSESFVPCNRSIDNKDKY